MEPEDLYVEGPAAGAKAPILVAHFEGALDAGLAGTLAVVQLLRAPSAQRVATFKTDELIDYRSHRPVARVQDWVTTEVTAPEIAVDLIHDDTGTPILILHGPEPDARWHTFSKAIEGLAQAAGVEVVFSFHGLPAAVPHSRPTNVHIQSTDPDLIPKQPQMGAIAKFPAPFSTFLQKRMDGLGVSGVTLLATVPYYMTETAFPKASSALLRRLSDMAELSLPIGDLERGAGEDKSQVDALLERNPDLERTVKALESHYDSISGAAAEGAELADQVGPDRQRRQDTSGLPPWDALFDGEISGPFPEAERVDEAERDSIGDAIGDAVENYLKTHSKRKKRGEGQLNSDTPPPVDNAPGRHVPRHRASKPWEESAEPGSLGDREESPGGKDGDPDSGSGNFSESQS